MSYIWAFGDSMTAPISGLWPEKPSPYSKWLGRYAKTSCEMLAEHFNYEYKNLAKAGSSNNQIFATFLQNHMHINSGDIVVIGWSPIMRYRLAKQRAQDKKMDWQQIWALGWNGGVEQSCLDGTSVTKEVAEHIVLNRYEFSDFYSQEINEWVSFIKEWANLKNVKIVTWTWCNENFGGKHSIDVDIPVKIRTDISAETNNIIKDGHYGEVGHVELFNEIIEFLNK